MSQSQCYYKGNSWCYTNIRYTQHKLTWIIGNFSLFCALETPLKSSTFVTKSSDNRHDEWQLLLSQCNDYYDYILCDIITLNLNCTSTEKESGTRSTLSYYLLNDTGEKKFVNETKNALYFNPSNSTQPLPEGLHLARKEDIMCKDNRLLTGGKLTVVCEMMIIEEPVNQSGKLEANIRHPPSGQLSEYYSKIFENGTLSDVTVAAGGKEFPAHKVVLSARSAVFAAMFEYEMAETIKNRVEISDINPDVLFEMLRFIYTGNTNKIKEMAGELYFAAEKYALEELKLMCEDALLSGLSATTAAEILVLADLHGAKNLKAQVIDFIHAHLVEVMATAEFKAVLVTNVDLMLNMLATVAIQKMLSTETSKKPESTKDGDD